MSGLPGLAIIPDKLESARASDFPLATDGKPFGVRISVERTRQTLSGYQAAVVEKDGKTYMQSHVVLTLSLEDAKRLWDGLPAAIEWAETKNKKET
jgi:hypothetical protein